MPWEYLNTPEWDGRFLYAAGYLSNRIEGKHLVDLNCGTARLLKYLPPTWGTYVGNDLHQCPSENMSVFLHLPDNLMAERIDRCDVLMCFGLADGKHANPEWESTTVSDSLATIASAHQPESVILETPVEYEQRTKVQERLVERLRGHKVAHRAEIRSSKGVASFSVRRVVILEKSRKTMKNE